MEEERFVTPTFIKNDQNEAGLRPKVFDEYFGQEKIKQNLKVFIEAAKLRQEPIDHVLLAGPPGLGKTTLAGIIASEMGANIRITSGPAIEKAGDLAAILTNIDENDILFIDEIHRLNRSVEEILYPAMEDFALDIIIGKGPSAKTIRLDLNRFTLIGATTKTGMLSSPLRDRFGVSCRLEMYSADELSMIVKRSSKILGININEYGANEIASRSRGTPRIANRLLRRTRDFADFEDKKSVTLEIAKKALDALEVDESGLDEMDKEIIMTIIEKFNGGPVGLNSLAVAVNEDAGTIEEVYEPYLIQQGFLQRTPRGREATKLAYEKFGKRPKKGTNPLFESYED